MTRLRPGVPLLLVLACTLSARGDDGPPLSNWGASPFWQPTPFVAESESGLRMRAAVAGSASPVPFVAIPPCRQYDSRSASALPNNTPRSVVLIGAPCGIPSNAQAVSVNITVFSIVGATGNGVFKVDTVSPPVVAWINYPPTEAQRGNAGTVPLTGGGAIVVQVNQGGGSLNFVVDVNGYYSPTGIVNSLNTLYGDLAITGGNNVTITPSGGQTLSIAASLPSGAMVFGKPGDTTLLGQGYTEILPTVSETWTTTSPTNSPEGRYWHCSVWTGTKMFVWGGQNSIYVPYSSGGLYDPATDSWSSTSITGSTPAARVYPQCVWTGTEVLVWGGEGASYAIFNDGARYDPVGNSWTAMLSSGAPAGRFSAAAVWASEASPPRLLIWGGVDRTLYPTLSYPAVGGAYNPANNTWSPLNTTNQPDPRSDSMFVWTGSKLVIWGGAKTGGVCLNDGKRYDPSSDTWADMAASGLTARYTASGVWTGTRMIVWGGACGSALGDGALYDPVGNAWTAMTSTNAPTARTNPVAVWTGSQMIVWSGYTTSATNSGAIYDPSANRWQTMTLTAAPPAGYGYRGHWTGLPLQKMIVWGSYGTAVGHYRTFSMFVKN